MKAPKGKRWGDLVREQLLDNFSLLHRATYELKEWRRTAEKNPCIRFTLTWGGRIQVNIYRSKWAARRGNRMDADNFLVFGQPISVGDALWEAYGASRYEEI